MKIILFLMISIPLYAFNLKKSQIYQYKNNYLIFKNQNPKQFYLCNHSICYESPIGQINRFSDFKEAFHFDLSFAEDSYFSLNVNLYKLQMYCGNRIFKFNKIKKLKQKLKYIDYIPNSKIEFIGKINNTKNLVLIYSKFDKKIEFNNYFIYFGETKNLKLIKSIKLIETKNQKIFKTKIGNFVFPKFIIQKDIQIEIVNKFIDSSSKTYELNSIQFIEIEELSTFLNDELFEILIKEDLKICKLLN